MIFECELRIEKTAKNIKKTFKVLTKNYFLANAPVFKTDF